MLKNIFIYNLHLYINTYKVKLQNHINVKSAFKKYNKKLKDWILYLLYNLDDSN